MLSWIKTKKRQRKAAILFVVLFIILGFWTVFFDTNMVSAQDEQDAFGVETVEQSGIALPSSDIRLIISRIIRAVLGFLGIVTVGIIIYGGFVIMTSQGNPEKVTKGRKILINAVIGLAIISVSFAIVQFIINSLSKAIGLGRQAEISAPAFNSFAGSGSLGRIIKDHYPFRDQMDVPRNTKIAITFAEPIAPDSLIEDSSGNGIFGDCFSDQAGTQKSEVCDRIKDYPDEPIVRIYFSPTEENQEISYINATVHAVRDANGDVYTVVFSPLEPLGSDVEDIWHTVYLTSNIKKANGDDLFVGQRNDYYEWEFQTNTSFDFTPPTIVATYPRNGQTTPRNTVVQIHFSEAVDPSTIDGAASGNNTLVFYSKEIEGEWQLSNGYKTAEFISNDACGQNSCGETIYCLPANGIGDNAPESQVLARTAELQHGAGNTEPDKFAAEFGDGISDMAGNAMDGNDDGVPDGRPDMPEDKQTIGAIEGNPDNFLWSFVVEDRIDRTAPHIIEVTPTADAQGVTGFANLTATFSKPMINKSLRENSNVSIEEYPANVLGPEGEELEDLWFSVFSELLPGDTSRVFIEHREFGPNDLDLYYFPSILGFVKDVNQNCLYPGRGPDLPVDSMPINCQITYDDSGFINSIAGCIPGQEYTAKTDTACVADISSNLHEDVPNCLNMLRDESLLSGQ